MPTRSLSFAALTLALWVMPSVGTQGMGTVGQQAIHTDATLIDSSPQGHAAARVVLLRADRTAEAALGF